MKKSNVCFLLSWKILIEMAVELKILKANARSHEHCTLKPLV